MFTLFWWGDSDPIWRYLVTFNVGLVQPPTRSILRAPLGGGNSNIFWCSPPIFGKMNPIWRLHIFQFGLVKNHQLVNFKRVTFPSPSPRHRWTQVGSSSHLSRIGTIASKDYRCPIEAGGKRGFRGLNPWDDFLYITPPKFNMAPEKWWLEDYILSFWDGIFSLAMLNFQGVMVAYKVEGVNMMMIFSDFNERRWYIILKLSFGKNRFWTFPGVLSIVIELNFTSCLGPDSFWDLPDVPLKAS